MKTSLMVDLLCYSHIIEILGEASNVPFFIGLNDVAKTGTWAWDQPIGKTLTVYK